MAIFYCTYCNSGCDDYCFASHKSTYWCHHSRCPGSQPGSGRGSSSSSRPERSRSTSKRHSGMGGGHYSQPPPRRESRSRAPGGMCHGRDSQTGERFSYPRNPNQDRDHMYLCSQYPPPRPGFRYGYDGAGDVITFAVDCDAEDYFDPGPPPPSRSASYRGGPSERSGSYSTRDTRSREDGDGLGRRPSTARRQHRRSYSRDEYNTGSYDPPREEGGGLGRRSSTRRRHHASREEYTGGGYEPRSRYPPDSFSRSFGGGGGSARRERSRPRSGGSSLRPEAAQEEPRRRIVKPEDVDWEIETVV